MANSKYLTVSALTSYIKYKFDADPHLRKVYVRGEVSNLKYHRTGIYFTLKDNESVIPATIFNPYIQNVKFQLENGMEVYITGDVNVFKRDGRYQLYVHTIEPAGVGSLFVALKQLEERLEKEGLFKPEFKQPIPAFPKKIGVLTATTGAAIRDICTTINRRFPIAEIVIYPTTVQGPNAPASIVKNIRIANQQNICDVLIVGRGGGSIEDLWAFNEEVVARAIFESKIPIISAVGHETDTTIADFVSDLRAPTPTAAAELAVQDKKDLMERLSIYENRLKTIVLAKIENGKRQLNKLESSHAFETPEKIYRPFLERLNHTQMQLESVTQMYLMKKNNELQRVHSIIKTYSPKHNIQHNRNKLDYLVKSLTKSSNHLLYKEKDHYISIVRALEALNPLSVMSRGFTITYKENQLVKSVSEITIDDELKIKFSDGQINAKVISKEEREVQ